MILVGLKKDCREDKAVVKRLQDKGVQPVSTEEGEALARSIKAVSFNRDELLNLQSK